MAKPIRWTAEKYAIALKGDAMPGLRSIAEGFSAADGYDLRHIDEWTPRQRRKVKDIYNQVRLLEAQAKIIVRPRNKKNLKILVDSFHGDIKIPKLRVAFVPFTSPKRLPGAKPIRPKIKFTARGVVIDAGIYANRYEAFNPLALIENARAEVKRAVDALPPAQLFTIQTGEYQSLRGKSAGLLADQVVQWMNKYNGTKPLTGSKRNDNPEAHSWWRWLNGVNAYSLGKNVKIQQMQNAISEGAAAAKARRHKQDLGMKRKVYKRK